MSVNTSNNVSGAGSAQAYYQTKHAGQNSQAASAASGTAAAAGDQYEAGGSAPAAGATYSRESQMQRHFQMAEARFASMRSAVESLVGGMSGESNGQAFWAMAANGGSGASLANNFRVDAATQERAQELTGEDGYYGVRRTTERIMEFAHALAGEGASEATIENLRSGVQAGFDYVAGLFGGFDNLPELTRDTHTSIMSEFDKWVGGGQASEASS